MKAIKLRPNLLVAMCLMVLLAFGVLGAALMNPDALTESVMMAVGTVFGAFGTLLTNLLKSDHDSDNGITGDN